MDHDTTRAMDLNHKGHDMTTTDQVNAKIRIWACDCGECDGNTRAALYWECPGCGYAPDGDDVPYHRSMGLAVHGRYSGHHVCGHCGSWWQIHVDEVVDHRRTLES